MKHLAFAIGVAVVAASTSACLEFDHTSTLGPTATGIGALAGSWSSSNLIPSPGSCTDFQWNVTDQSGTLPLRSGSRTRQGNATAPGLTTCAISLTGTAELTTDSIRVPYSGDTCLGKVSGVENLQRH